MSSTFEPWTVRKIAEYLTLGLLSIAFEISITVQQLTFLTHPVYVLNADSGRYADASMSYSLRALHVVVEVAFVYAVERRVVGRAVVVVEFVVRVRRPVRVVAVSVVVAVAAVAAVPAVPAVVVVAVRSRPVVAVQRRVVVRVVP